MVKHALAFSFVAISLLGAVSAYTDPGPGSAPIEKTAPARLLPEARNEQAVEADPQVVPALRVEPARRTLRASCTDCVIG